MVWLPEVKKLCFDRIPACDGQMDRQTDGRTNVQTSFDGIVRVMHSIAR